MNLSNTDMEQVAKLQTKQRIWSWLRWLLLFCSLYGIENGVQGYVRLLHLGGEAGALGLKFAMSYTLLSALLFIYVLARWRGDRTARMLLRLLER